jgi:hypothetical protein
VSSDNATLTTSTAPGDGTSVVLQSTDAKFRIQSWKP